MAKKSSNQGLNHIDTLQKLTGIFELIKSILYMEDSQELLNKITKEAASAFNANICLLRLAEEGKLPVKASFGVPNIENIKEELAVSIGEGVAGRTFEAGKTSLFKCSDDFDYCSALSRHMALETAICTPLIIGNRIIGTFGLYNKMSPDGVIIPFSEDDKVLLEGFASIAAVVIDKLVLFQRLSRKEKEAVEAAKSAFDLRELLEGVVENSADAIVTTDLDGRVTSWNRGAEKIYGFTKEEVIGRFLPFVPDTLRDAEKGYLEVLKNGQTIKDIETIRITKNGRIIDVNLTLSPVKDATGNIIGTSGISRDISEKKRTERELRHKNEELSRLYFISSAMRGTLELDKLLRMILAAVTMGEGFGFNRAILFLLDETKNALKIAMGVGPSSLEEASDIWLRLWKEGKTLPVITDEIDKNLYSQDSLIAGLCCDSELQLESNSILAKVFREKIAINVVDVNSYSESQSLFTEKLGSNAYALVPLIAKDRVIGVLWVDNLFTGTKINDPDIDFLRNFTDHMASAVENARLFEKVITTEREMENIFESISDLLYYNSPDYTVKRINKAVAEKIGMSADEIIGRKCYEVFHKLDKPFVKCPHHKTLKTGKPFIEEMEDPNLGGTFLVSSSPIFDQKESLLGTIHIVRDISELKKLREKLNASERMAALGEMAAKVAHEIRNPLLSIGGFAKRLEKNSKGDLKEYAKIIVDETRRLESVLSDILIFVKSGYIEKKKIHIDDIIDSISTLLIPELEAKGNTLSKEIEPDIFLWGDPYRLKEVFINLISNANQATDYGKISLKVYRQNRNLSLSYLNDDEMADKQVVIEVSDNGCGIKQEDISRIFDPFFTTRSMGTGLGLSITKRIIEEHGGKVDVDSVWSEGTVFKIYLPIKEDK
jgi:PAS domain S-box-containing protein